MASISAVDIGVGPRVWRRARDCRAPSVRGTPGGPPAPAPGRRAAMRCASSAAMRLVVEQDRRRATGRSRPDNARMVVDLPAPLAPISATSLAGPHLEGHIFEHRRRAIAGGQLSAVEDRIARRSSGVARGRAAHVAAAEIGLDHPRIVADSRPACRSRSARRHRAPRRGRRCPSPASCRARPGSRRCRDRRCGAAACSSASLSARIRPAAGSSSSSTRGRIASARAISTSRRSTCGRSPAGVASAPR